MQSYIPPIDDYRFLLEEVLDFDGAMTALGKDVDCGLATAVLEILCRSSSSAQSSRG